MAENADNEMKRAEDGRRRPRNAEISRRQEGLK